VDALFAFYHWLEAAGGLPGLYLDKNHTLFSTLCSPAQLLPALAKHLGSGALYLGWFSLPVTFLFLPHVLAARSHPRTFIPAAGAGLAFVACSFGFLLFTRRIMPTGGNILVDQGIGPLTLRDKYYSPQSLHLPSLGKGFWLGITAVSMLGGAFLVAGAVSAALRFWRSLSFARLRPEPAAAVFLVLCTLVYLFPVMALGGWDRYYLPALPLLLAAIGALTSQSGGVQSRACLGLSVLAVSLLALFAVCGTRDYFAWNRVRWAALNEFVASGKATPMDMDGGFEFNGWYLYDPSYKQQSGKSMWWVYGDSFLMTFGEMPGWKPIRTYSFSHWLPPYTGRIYLLERKVAD
jgi:hypothetical protein